MITGNEARKIAGSKTKNVFEEMIEPLIREAAKRGSDELTIDDADFLHDLFRKSGPDEIEIFLKENGFLAETVGYTKLSIGW